MRLLPNPHLVWRALTQLFEYYLYSVYALLCPLALDLDTHPTNVNSISGSISPQLRRTLQRLRLAFDPTSFNSSGNSSSGSISPPTPTFSSSSVSSHSTISRDIDGVIVKCGVPKMSENVNLAAAKDLYGLAARVVAVESLRFLTDAVKEAFPLTQTLVPSEQLGELNEFYSDTISIVPDLRTHIYRAITQNFVNMEQLQNMVLATKWELKELGLDHSAYVEHLLKEFRDVSRRWEEVEREHYKFPASVRRLLWENLINNAMETLVEGYSRTKKCNNEGRALMSLDLKIFTHSLQNLINNTGMRPPLNMSNSVVLVENFIKAFYLPPSELVVFSKDHPEYSSRQIQSILNCNPGNSLSKKQRQEIYAVLDDIEKSRAKR